MKKSKKKETLINLIEFLTTKTTFYLKKIGKLVNNKNTYDTIFIFTEVIITLIILWLLKFPFDIIEEIGVFLVYLVGSTFRNILSIILRCIIQISYFIFCLIMLLNVFRSIFKNKELNLVETDRKKDSKIKKKVFTPILEVIIICLDLLTVPFVLASLGILILLGMNLALLVNGYKIISLFPILIGLLIMFISVILVLSDLKKGGKK